MPDLASINKGYDHSNGSHLAQEKKTCIYTQKKRYIKLAHARLHQMQHRGYIIRAPVYNQQINCARYKIQGTTAAICCENLAQIYKYRPSF